MVTENLTGCLSLCILLPSADVWLVLMVCMKAENLTGCLLLCVIVTTNWCDGVSYLYIQFYAIKMVILKHPSGGSYCVGVVVLKDLFDE